MNGYERIKEQYLVLTNKEDALKRITAFLMKQQDMSDLYLQEQKNLTEMMAYIEDLAKEKAVNNVAVIEDSQVYDWAIDYFSKSNEELGIKEKELTNCNNVVAKKEISKSNQTQLSLL